jgi:Tol biopolymer transport system component
MYRMTATLLLLAALTPPVLHAQSGSPLRTPFTSDSMEVNAPTMSPDGRWLVFARQISNQEFRLMIRPVAGGEPRELLEMKGVHDNPAFTRQGDRLVFHSSIPRRGDGDVNLYLVSAPFDSKTGTLTAAPRQVALDPIQRGGRVRTSISPDGRLVAYITSPGNALRVIPLVGGNATTLAESEDGSVISAPAFLTWSSDGRSVDYSIRKGEFSTRYRVSRDGGAPTVVARMAGSHGPMLPDGQHYVIMEGRGRRTLRVFSLDGKEVANVSIPSMNGLSFTADGRTLLGRSDNTTTTIKLVPIGGGPARALGRGASYEWGLGWSRDGKEVHVLDESGSGERVRILGLDGRERSSVQLPDDADLIGFQDGHMIFRQGRRGTPTGWSLVSQRISDGTRTVLANDLTGGCCGASPAGGMYYGITGDDFYYTRMYGDRLQLMAMRLGGKPRQLAELPRDRLAAVRFAVAGDKVAYDDVTNDSLRIRVITKPGAAPITVASRSKSTGVSDLAWSHDGRMLAFHTQDQAAPMSIIRFDDAGRPAGTPITFTLPFDYSYETFWLPDGSGLTMIAQPRGGPTAEVALVKLADPQNPVLLSKGDPGSKWGHMLSPDGKYVAYPAETTRGSRIHALDLEALLKNATAKK